MIRVEQIYIYPVKSLAGIERQRATVTPQGLVGDREWMLVDQNNRFITQRKITALASIKPSLRDNQLYLSTATMGDLPVPLPDIENKEAPRIEVKIWRDHCHVFTVADEVNAWITEAAKSESELRLVYFDKLHQRKLDSERFGQGDFFFADAAPFLFTNLASLRELNKGLEHQRLVPADIRQFRPNIVLSGIEAWREHQMNQLQTASDIRFKLVDHCQRCSVINVDQDTGVVRNKGEPLKQLATINTMPDKPKAPAFGVNTILEKGWGKIISTDEELSE